MKQTVLIVIVAMMALSKTYAQGHGPLFGLQTPTLAKGGVDFNAVAMSLATEDDQSFMLRYIWSYGVTEDLQLNITTPLILVISMVINQKQFTSYQNGEMQRLRLVQEILLPMVLFIQQMYNQQCV